MAGHHGQWLQRCALHKARSCCSLHSLRMTPHLELCRSQPVWQQGSGVRRLEKRVYDLTRERKGEVGGKGKLAKVQVGTAQLPDALVVTRSNLR